MYSVLNWPQAVVHISPSVGLYGMVCFVCGHQFVAVVQPGKRVVDCPMCSCKQPETYFPMPENAAGSDGVWIDPGGQLSFSEN